ncbi:putative fusaric acid resistance protein [Gluconacetobacter diazotrophicus PA1 5]|uniref:Putative fusaric acid resistance protein n=2 Tax=Gluconacetobacter diazotrophicus TaxID=33996 RepID=A9GZN6_GLUDA|nr:putative fusaric acid resistance protein [Gluconacetobacter diazotrophicus PA1 5]
MRPAARRAAAVQPGMPVAPHIAQRLSWLYAPSKEDFAFALRTALAAILSLLIAMWMELDSPQWAPLTVWVVAQSSRGESLSKARWRVVGTLVGSVAAMALVAAFPQAPGLFFCSLAVWIGLCCAVATLLDNYRAYGLILTGFTSAIVATGAILEPDHVFEISMARTSYILLGVICEATLAVIFMPSLLAQARRTLHLRLATTFGETRAAAAGLLEGDIRPDALGKVLMDLVAFNSQIEFAEIELEPGSRTGDHARAALAGMLVMLARARGLSLLAAGPHADRTARDEARAVGHILRDSRLDGSDAARTPPLRHAWQDRPAAMDTAEDSILPRLFTALLDDTDHVMAEIVASDRPVRGDRFRFRTVSRRHAVEAVENGVRAGCAIIGAWLIWEVTAWQHGPAFVSFVALVYGLLATRENPILAGMPFMTGGLYCALVAMLFVFLVIPAITAPEVLVLALLVPMTIGGLAARNARTAGYAFSFNMFLPVLIGPMNQARYDEVSFLNTTCAFLLSILFAVLTYRVIVPFRVDSHMRRTAAWTERRLRGVAGRHARLSGHQWLATTASSLVRILRNASAVPPDMLAQYMQAQLRAMTVGTCVIELRTIARQDHLPGDVRTALWSFLDQWKKGHPGLQAVQAWMDDRQRETRDEDERTEMRRIISCLHLIRISG